MRSTPEATRRGEVTVTCKVKLEAVARDWEKVRQEFVYARIKLYNVL